MKRLRSACICILLLLSGCGGGGGGGTNGGGSGSAFTVSGVAAKGPVEFAATELFALNANGSLSSLATGTTFTDGIFNLLTLSPAATGHYLIEVRGGLANSRYRDEATSSNVFMGADDKLWLVMKDLPGVDQVAVTPLTTLAAKRALALIAAGVDVATAVESANTDVARQFGLDDIVHTQPVDPTDSDSALEGDLAQRRYGLVLGGLSLLANDNSIIALDLATALADDAADGVLDNAADGQPILVPQISGGTTLPLSSSLGLAQWAVRTNDYAASGTPLNYTNLTGSTMLGTAETLGTTSTSALRITTAALPAWIEGQSGGVTLQTSGGSGAVTWSGTPPSPWTLDAGSGVISGTAPVLGGGTTVSISAPFTVTASDGVGGSAQATFRITVTTTPPTMDVGTFALLAEEEVSFSQDVGTAFGGQAPYRFRLASGTGFLPSGVSLINNPTFPTSVLVSGTPAAGSAGTYTFGICAVDAIGNEDCDPQSLTLTVSAPATGSGNYDGSYSGSYTGCRPSGAGSAGPACNGDVYYFGTMTITVQNGQVTGTGTNGETLTGTVAAGGSFSGSWNNNIGTASFTVTAGNWGVSSVSGSNGDVSESVFLIIN